MSKNTNSLPKYFSRIVDARAVLGNTNQRSVIQPNLAGAVCYGFKCSRLVGRMKPDERFKQKYSTKSTVHQWRGGSEAAGEAARLMAPPLQSYFFCLLVWDAYHVVGTTCNDRRSLRNTFEWMRVLQAPSSSMVESWWRFRGLGPWKLQRICILRYLILGLILPNNRWMVMHFFMCIAVQSHRKIPKAQSF